MESNFISEAGGLLARRAFLNRAGRGIGGLALANLLGALPSAENRLQAAAVDVKDRWKGVLPGLHHAPRARRVIFLYQAGGPSHLETFDYKPKLKEMDGKPMPESLTKGQQIAQLQGRELKCLAPQTEFRRFGQSGQEMSSLFPHLGSVADELCVIRGMHTDQINHDPAHTLMNTGSIIAGRPSMGSWLLYGLGAETQDLPGYVVLVSSGRGGQMQPIAARQWHSGFLPSRFQGVRFESKGDPVLYIRPPQGVDPVGQRRVVDAVNDLNRISLESGHDPEVSARITQYEMAFRMQTSVPGLMDLSSEPESALALYGAQPGDGSFASNCLLARRLAERGVRFIQLYHRDWDHHDNVRKDVPLKAEEVDRPCAALLKDLKQRGMLEDTLVVWGGEFGRTPMAQGTGRDHHIKGFSMWMAGGGVKGGLGYGATDEFGYAAVENAVHVNDFHATLLHLFGVEHTRLTYRFQGRDFRLTDIAGRVVREVLA